MGWGKKTTGAKPQPERVLLDPTASVLPEDHPSVDEIVEMDKDRASDAAKAEMTWAQFRSKKGWTPETVAMVLYEFVRERAMFDDLVKFAKGRR